MLWSSYVGEWRRDGADVSVEERCENKIESKSEDEDEPNFSDALEDDDELESLDESLDAGVLAEFESLENL